MISAGRDYQRMQDYIVGRLSDDESHAFENRLVNDPALVRELEQSLRLREGLQRLREQSYFRRAASRNTSFRIWLPALVAAAGAGVALFLGVYRGTWVHRSTGLSPVLMASLESRLAGVEPLIAAHFTFVSVRGSSTPDLDLPSAGLIEFRAAPVSRMGAPRYRVTLLRQNQGNALEPLGTVAGVALSRDGYVHGYADAARLEPGSYVLRIERDAGVPGPADSFLFNLRARGAAPSP
jgi:anti-sigma factor RsiW